MEQLKLIKKETIILNTVIFLLMSYLFLYLQYAYRHQLSPFSPVYLRKSIELFWYIAFPVLVSCYLVWRKHDWSRQAYTLCVFMVEFKVIEGLFIQFNKVIVIALFFFTVIAYFIYQIYTEYFSQASLNSNYGPNDLFDPLLREIQIQVQVGEETLAGVLTNWDETGCFVKFSSPMKALRQVRVNVHFRGRTFTQEGEVVAQTLDLQGVGIKFGKTEKELSLFNWSEFIEIIDEIGFQPERLR
jgi:hypothetical protein